MRDLTELDQFRVPLPKIYGLEDHYNKKRNGAFVIECDGVQLRILASVGEGWDHVSVSVADRIPTWLEMDFVKRLFFKVDETAMQLHVPARDHVNIHPNVLHLWRPCSHKIPLPPKNLV